MPRGYRMGLLLLGDSPSVPDGKTVTPINDVPTWLQCAGIPSTTYTTLAEVLADSSLLRMLINSENAMDYLVRCKEWIKQNALVPTMTSETTPSGVCTASSLYSSSYPAWKVFDKDLSVSSSWVSNGTTNQWLKYRFPTAQCVKSVSIYTNFSGRDSAIKNFRVEGSNNDSEFTTIYTGIYLNQSGNQSFSFNNNESYLYYRLYILDRYTTTSTTIQFVELQYYDSAEEGITDSQSAMQFIGANDYASNLLLGDSDWCEAICNSEYSEDIFSPKVPTMTSNTTPSGECSASGYISGYEPYKAYDGDVSTWWGAYEIGENVKVWSQYAFDNARKAYKIRGICRHSSNDSSVPNIVITIKGSNDNSNFEDIYSETLTTSSGKASFNAIISNPSNWRYYRFEIYHPYRGTGLRPNMYENDIQVYGRDKGGVQSWLLSANITNKNYTTLNQVLADTDTLTALISSHNAMDYLVTCTSWANDICSNQTAMTLIGNDNYASNKLLSDSTWLNAICNSTYFESVLNVKVPLMTSNNTPEGVCIGDATNGTYNYQAFDGNDTSRTYVTNQIGKTIGYQFISSCKVKKVFLKPYWNGDTYNVEGSNDGDTWDNIGSIIGNASGSTAVVNAMIDYTYYRFNQSTRISSNNLQEFLTAQFYGRQDV